MGRAALALLLLIACRSGAASRAKTETASDAAATKTPGPATADDPASPADKCDGGIAWDGKPAGCAYEVEGCCYSDAEKACAVAKCDAPLCEVLETYPAQVRCRTP